MRTETPKILVDIIYKVSSVTNISTEEIMHSRSQKSNIVIARAAFMILAKGKASLSDIGKAVGNKDHATVVYHNRNSVYHKPVMAIVNKIKEEDDKIEVYNPQKPKLKLQFYEIIIYRPWLRRNLMNIIENQNDESIIALARARHPIFSRIDIAEMILLEFNKTSIKKYTIEEMIQKQETWK